MTFLVTRFGRLKNAAVSRCEYADCLYSVKVVEVLEKMEKVGLIAGFIAQKPASCSRLFNI
jgi:ribosomal protein S8